MKILLNPKYEALRAYLTHLEEHFNKEGQEIHRGRNVIRTLRVNGLTLCVKQYAPPRLFRRIQQVVYKSSKGKLAYIRPLLLKERGFESPEPIAYIRYTHGLLKNTTYFVCLFSNYRFCMQDVTNVKSEQNKEVLKFFARYAALLHNTGFLHRDFSSSNILYDKIDGRFHFSLIDTNSMKCGLPVSIEEGCRNLAQLTGDEEFFKLLATYYAKARKTNEARCLRLINEARAQK